MILTNTLLRDDRDNVLERVSKIERGGQLQLLVQEPIATDLYRFPIDKSIRVYVKIQGTTEEKLSLEFLKEFSNIVLFEIQHAWAIADAEFISTLAHAKKILFGSVLKGSISIAPLAALNHLEELEILLTPKDIAVLQSLKSLQTLILNRGKVESLEVIQSLPALTALDLFSLKIESLRGLENSKIKFLNLQKLPKLNDVSQLPSLSQLTNLTFNNCTLRKLPKLPHLKELGLRDVKDFEDASELNNSLQLARIFVSGKKSFIPWRAL
ncbi:MAG TPA: hypothetical protein VK970_21225 [Candidatus Methylacidiphilales bacterium]|nr:hypothetical protein [Candidatus Methylacidiphilales bacterium]